jgi:SPP1 gp7 family putative phage head morphogenesis protein
MKLLDSLTPVGQEAVEEYAKAIVSGDLEKTMAAYERLAQVLGSMMSVSELAGRIRTLHEATVRGWAPPVTISVQKTGQRVPAVVFEEAIEDLLEREPVARAAGITARSIQEVWSDHGFALAKSASVEITKKVRDTIGMVMRHPDFNTVEAGTAAIQSLTGWTQSYAENCFRTTGATVYVAGRFKQMSDPSIHSVIPAFMYSAIRDADVRPNHWAAHGLIAGVDDPIWNRFSPPMGFNCRCDLVLKDRYELQKHGLLDSKGNVIRYLPHSFHLAYPDPGFSGGRPDRRGSYAYH